MQASQHKTEAGSEAGGLNTSRLATDQTSSSSTATVRPLPSPLAHLAAQAHHQQIPAAAAAAAAVGDDDDADAAAAAAAGDDDDANGGARSRSSDNHPGKSLTASSSWACCQCPVSRHPSMDGFCFLQGEGFV